jgi:hypothetical protein
MSGYAPLEPHHQQNLFSDSKVGFLFIGEKSSDRSAQSRAPAMGTVPNLLIGN